MDKLTGTNLQKNINSIQKTTNPVGIEGNIALLGAALAKAFQFITRTGKSKNITPNLRGASIEDISNNMLLDEIMYDINPKIPKDTKKAKKKKLTLKATKEELEIRGKKLSAKIKERAEKAVAPITKEQNKKNVKLVKRANKIGKRANKIGNRILEL
jgi:hypothetical protein